MATEKTAINSIVTRTAWGVLYQNIMFGRFKIPDLPHISLNERTTIMQDSKIPEGEFPYFQYYAIGDKGHYTKTDSDGELFIEPAKHRATDSGPFNLMPFVLRAEGNDLTKTQRANYALRTQIEKDGVQYWAYYLKRIPGVRDKQPTVYQTTVSEGEETTKEYITSVSDLYPERPIIAPDTAVTTASQYITVSTPITIVFDEFDVQELFNVARVLYNNDKRAIISEIMLCTGYDFDRQTTTDGNAQIVFTESIQTWIAAFISTYQNMAFNNKGFTMELELGGVEPMLTETDFSGSTGLASLAAASKARITNVARFTPN